MLQMRCLTQTPIKSRGADLGMQMSASRSQRTCASYLLGYVLRFIALEQRPH